MWTKIGASGGHCEYGIEIVVSRKLGNYLLVKKYRVFKTESAPWSDVVLQLIKFL